MAKSYVLAVGAMRGIGLLSRAGAVMCSVIITGMVIATMIDTVCRYAFNNPISGVFEYNEVMFPIFVFLGLAYTQLEDSHLRVSFFIDRCGPGGRRLLTILGLILAMMVAATAGYHTWHAALRSYEIQEEYWAVIVGATLYVWPARFAISIGFWMLFLQCLADLVGTIWSPSQDDVREGPSHV